MSKPNPAPKALAVALAGAAAISVSAVVLAQEAPIERIEITGSAIRRIEAETALPVTTLTREDIAKTGATTATDLLQMLPAMQGFVTSSDSVNGGGGGITTAALHSLPSKYTLVLVDGQRVATEQLNNSFGGGFATNLESIPLDAVERVEILTDGASALYGSDAIAGVVNFILRKNSTAGSVYFNWNATQHKGGDSWTAGFTKGYGDLNADHFNLLFNFSHDQQQTVLALDRPFSARGAFFPFNWKGTKYIYDGATSNTEPANVIFSAYPTALGPGANNANVQKYSLNPFYEAHGNCGGPLAHVLTGSSLPGTVGESCRFNYAATVEDIPPSSRDAGLMKGYFKVNQDTTAWAEFLISNFVITPRYAPPAQPFGMNGTGRFPTLYNTYVQPYLTTNNLTAFTTSTKANAPLATMGYRAVAAGGRTDDYTTEAEHFAMGIDGTMYGFDYKAAFTRSHNTLSDDMVGGYASFNQLNSLVKTGAYDPIGEFGAQNLKAAVLHTNASIISSDLTEYNFSLQRPVFELPGGSSIVAVGGDYEDNIYRVDYSPLLLAGSGYSTQGTLTDNPVGGNSGQVPFHADRGNWGAFAEWNFPVFKSLEVIASGRYDYYNKVHSGAVFGVNPDPVTGLIPQLNDAQLGNTFSAGVGKVTVRWQPIERVLLRGSYGRGFKAPALTDIATTLTFNGSTTGSYACPFPGSPGCLAGNAQYDLVAGGNAFAGSLGLKPEKSRQWTGGFRVEPIDQLSLGADVWDVKLNNQILSQGIAESVAFVGTGPQTYKNLFINPYVDPVGGFNTIALEQLPFNGGEAEYMGLDWDFSYRLRTPVGNLAAQWTGTQMFRQKYTFGPGQPFNTDLGVYGPDQTVVFRTQFHMLLSLQTGPWTNTLTGHYKSGYHDATHIGDNAVFLANANGTEGPAVDFAGLDVPSYTTFDWQTVYDFTKAMHVTLGIKNLFDRDPPFTLQNAGGGNQIGYDGRYADPLGRVFYVIGKYTF